MFFKAVILVFYIIDLVLILRYLYNYHKNNIFKKK